MRAPLSWIREFTPVEGEPADIGRALSALGLVVEAMEPVPAPWPGIVVARVLGTRAHPSADRIQLVDVDAGDGQALQICCGAFNMVAGDLVPLATLGTTMPNGMEIARRKMRGEWSNGMLCSAPEVGLGPEGPEPAIYVLAPGSAQAGQALAEVLGLAADVVYDLEVSPNRSDCFCVAGIARDLAAGLGLSFQLPEPARAIDLTVAEANVVVDASAAELCRRFTGTVIADVGAARVAPGVARRLALCGMRSISPVVDVSNYVMLELGQPNHPYDIQHLGGEGLVARAAAAGEELTTLDGTVRQLRPGDCVIADAHGALVGVAGIMGGAVAEISDHTGTVLLEMANFAPRAVAATGKRLGLLSEARTRFERGVDIEVADRAIDRFVELLGPGPRRGPTTDVRAATAPVGPVRLRTARVNSLLGTFVAPQECASILTSLGFAIVPSQEKDFDVTVPSWRPDCEREVDLIEEVARIYGYETIPRSLPSRPTSATGLSSQQKGRRQVKQVLAGAGASEAWTSSFCSAADILRAGLSPALALELENPLDQSQDLLRASLLPGLLGALRFNQLRQVGAVSLFEAGHVFCRADADDGPTLVPGVVEKEQLALVATGAGTGAAYAVQAWLVLSEALRLEDARLEPLGAERAPEAELEPEARGQSGAAGADAMANAVALHPGRRSAIVVSGTTVGTLGELAPEVASRYDLEGRVAVLVVDLVALLSGPRHPWTARPVSRYPASDVDLAFVVGDEVVAGHLEATLRRAAGDLAQTVVLFDVWRGPGLPPGHRSLAFRARLRAPGRTLTDAEVAQWRDQVAAVAQAEHGAVLRGA